MITAKLAGNQSLHLLQDIFYIFHLLHDFRVNGFLLRIIDNDITATVPYSLKDIVGRLIRI